MATISIKDLPENVELDRQAMRAIAGGARSGGRRGFPEPAPAGSRIIDYPGSLSGNAAERVGGRPATGKPVK